MTDLAERAVAHLARLPREPHLHVKRTLAVQARELLEAEGDDPAALAIMHDRHALELPDRLALFSELRGPPARDPFVEVGPAPPDPLNDALIEAEVAAATAAEVSDAGTRRALARFAAERMEATVAYDDEWGTRTVDVGRYSVLMALPAADRVEQLLGKGGRSDEDAAL